jgi:hypothetical protein
MSERIIDPKLGLQDKQKEVQTTVGEFETSGDIRDLLDLIPNNPTRKSNNTLGESGNGQRTGPDDGDRLG